jgi:antitoxin HicB
MQYPVRITNTGADFWVQCRDLPEMNSVGDTLEEALREAVDGIASVLQSYMDDRQAIPAPSVKRRGEHYVALPALDVAKVGLYQAMLAKGLRKADLVRLLDVHGPQVDRLLSLLHKSKLEQVEDALAKLGYRVNVSVEPRESRRAA